VLAGTWVVEIGSTHRRRRPTKSPEDGVQTERTQTGRAGSLDRGGSDTHASFRARPPPLPGASARIVGRSRLGSV